MSDIEKIEREVFRIDNMLCRKYFGVSPELPEDRLEMAISWLTDDIECILMNLSDEEESKRLKDITDIISRSDYGAEILDGVDVRRIVRSIEIRKDFDKALAETNDIEALAKTLDCSMTREDVVDLAELHANGKYRKKIEDLLDACNFHKERELLSEEKYDELQDLIF